jgi:hypothetical protein
MTPVMILLFANTAVSIVPLGMRRDDRDPADGESDGSCLRRAETGAGRRSENSDRGAPFFIADH